MKPVVKKVLIGGGIATALLITGFIIFKKKTIPTRAATLQDWATFLSTGAVDGIGNWRNDFSRWQDGERNGWFALFQGLIQPDAGYQAQVIPQAKAVWEQYKAQNGLA